MKGKNRNKKFKVLFVGDPNLGTHGANIIKQFFAGATCIIWDIKQQDSLNTNEIKEKIHSRTWDICFSFYNDFIFDDEDLAHMRLALNIHPSLPVLRGMGYDTIPLIEGHKYFGVTLHKINNKIDSGKIISIFSKKLPKHMTHTQLRKESQELCLDMLKRTADEISKSNNLINTKKNIAAKNEELNAVWGADYTTRKNLQNLLNKLRGLDPEHRVFK